MIIGTITLLMLYFGGGGGFSFEKAFKPFVEEAVKDETRCEQIVDLTKQADEMASQSRKEVKDVWAKELMALVADYDATEDRFRAFRERADRSRLAAQQGLLDIRMEIVRLMTEEEWNAMYLAIDTRLEEEKQKREEKDK